MMTEWWTELTWNNDGLMMTDWRASCWQMMNNGPAKFTDTHHCLIISAKFTISDPTLYSHMKYNLTSWKSRLFLTDTTESSLFLALYFHSYFHTNTVLKVIVYNKMACPLTHNIKFSQFSTFCFRPLSLLNKICVVLLP